MAKAVYVGINSVARKVKKMYVGVGSVARKVKKAYVGIGGVARLVFSAFPKLVANGSTTISTGDHYHVFGGASVQYTSTRTRVIRDTKGGGIYNLTWIDQNFVYGSANHVYDSYSDMVALPYGPTMIGSGNGWDGNEQGADPTVNYEAYDSNMTQFIVTGVTKWRNCDGTTLVNEYIVFTNGCYKNSKLSGGSSRRCNTMDLFDRNCVVRTVNGTASYNESSSDMVDILTAANSYSVGDVLGVIDANLLTFKSSCSSGVYSVPTLSAGQYKCQQSSYNDWCFRFYTDRDGFVSRVYADNHLTGATVDLTSSWTGAIIEAIGAGYIQHAQLDMSTNHDGVTTLFMRLNHVLFQVDENLQLIQVDMPIKPPTIRYDSWGNPAGWLGNEFIITTANGTYNDNEDDTYNQLLRFAI